MKAANSPTSRSGSLMLPGAYRRPRRKGGKVYLYWYASREPGAPQIARFEGRTLAEAEAAERAGAAQVAEAYGAIDRRRKIPASCWRCCAIMSAPNFPSWRAPRAGCGRATSPGSRRCSATHR